MQILTVGMASKIANGELVCPSLALDDEQRYALAGHLHRVRVPELAPRGAVDHARPRVAPLMTQNSGPDDDQPT